MYVKKGYEIPFGVERVVQLKETDLSNEFQDLSRKPNRHVAGILKWLGCQDVIDMHARDTYDLKGLNLTCNVFKPELQTGQDDGLEIDNDEFEFSMSGHYDDETLRLKVSMLIGNTLGYTNLHIQKKLCACHMDPNMVLKAVHMASRYPLMRFDFPANVNCQLTLGTSVMTVNLGQALSILYG